MKVSSITRQDCGTTTLLCVYLVVVKVTKTSMGCDYIGITRLSIPKIRTDKFFVKNGIIFHYTGLDLYYKPVKHIWKIIKSPFM